MSNALTDTVTKKKKKPIFKRWWFWVLSIFALIIIAGSLSSGSSAVLELSKATTMNRQEIIDKFGRPDEIIREDNEGYIYGYNAGFIISGTDKGATSIVMSGDMVKNESSDSYKMLDATLNSSFDENVKRLGEPNLSITKDGKKNAVYLTKEDFLFILSSEYGGDKISTLELSVYDQSSIVLALDVSNLLGSLATEDEVKKVYKINDIYSDADTTTYTVEGFNLIVNNQDNIVKGVFIAENSIYNIHGVRVGDSINKANEAFGNPINTMEGVKNTTQYIYQYDDVTSVNNVLLSIHNDSKEIGYIEVSSDYGN